MISIPDIIQKVLFETISDPMELSEFITRLAAFTQEASYARISLQISYGKKWEAIKVAGESDKKTDMRMYQEPEFEALEKAKTLEKTIVSVIQALKHRLRVISENTRF